MAQEMILLVDDDAGLLQLHQLALKSRTGFEIQVALTGPAAIEQINSRQPALVIVDLMMPEMSGIDVCRWIRAQPAFAAIPVVMLTGLVDPAAHLEARQAGANDVWLKPMTPSELGARIRQLLPGQ
jgi:DNA-binding response OmpR family regulator